MTPLLRSLSIGVVCIASAALASPQPAYAGTSVTCPNDVAAIDDDGAQAVWQRAQRSLVEQADGGTQTFPFGSSGRQRTPLRTSASAWTAGFYPASLWLTYANSGEDTWLALARDFSTRLLPKASRTDSHDLGFMVGLPAGLGLALDPDARMRARYQLAMDTAARTLARRWNPKVGALKSGDYAGEWGVIIDSAMNAPLLIRVGDSLGGPEGAELRSRGVRHMLLLAEDFVRPDGSTIHRQTYDTTTGRLIGPINGQGRSLGSTWARGQAWAIAGFAEAYARTGNDVFREAAERTADHWMAKVPRGCVPAWDFSVSRQSAPRDSSAAAIAAYGIASLADAEPDITKAAGYRSYALDLLGTLAQPRWTPLNPTNEGILQRQAYNVPAQEVEGTYSWGDTFLLLAVASAR